MVQPRKPSSFTYPTYVLHSAKVNIDSRLRVMLTKRSVVYICTALVILLLLSFIATGLPDPTGVLSQWTPKTEHADPFDLTPILDPVVDGPNHLDLESNLGLNEPISATPPSPPPPFQDVNKTEDGFPLISTNNKSKVVLLAGATGRGNFWDVADFYSKVVSNRLDYINAHGISEVQKLTHGRL